MRLVIEMRPIIENLRYISPAHVGHNLSDHVMFCGGQRGLVVKRLPGNQEVGGSNPTTAMY